MSFSAHTSLRTKWKSSILTRSSRKAIDRFDSKADLIKGWEWEILSWLVSFLAVIAILTVAYFLDRRTMPHWPLGLTPNTTVSLLGEVAKAALIFPVAEAIGQLKWLWFRSRERSLRDFELYDLASRGPLGSFRVLFRPHLWGLVSFGALITVFAVGMLPSLQQTLMYATKTIDVDTSRVPCANVYYGREEIDLRIDEGFMIENRMRGAIYGGLFGVAIPTPMTTPTCSTGNCTWDPYSSLAVCHSCNDITSILRPNISLQDDRGESFAWSAPNDFRFDSGSIMKTSTVLAPLYHPTLKNPILVLHSAFHASGLYESEEPPTAHECVLYFCVRLYNGSSVNGVFTENIVHAWPDSDKDTHTSIDAPQLPPVNPTQWPSNSINLEQEWHTIQVPGSPVMYRVDILTLVYLRDTIGWLLAADIKTKNRLPQKDVSELARALYKAMTGSNYTKSVPDMVGRMAVSMTNIVRNEGGLDESTTDLRAVGKATKLETHVQVRWLWLFAAISLVLLGLCFLLLTVRMTSKAHLSAWKSSTLATLAIGLDQKSRSSLVTQITSSHKHNRLAKDVVVRLSEVRKTEPRTESNGEKACRAELEEIHVHSTELLFPVTGGRQEQDIGERPSISSADDQEAELESDIEGIALSASDQEAEDTALLKTPNDVRHTVQ